MTGCMERALSISLPLLLLTLCSAEPIKKPEKPKLLVPTSLIDIPREQIDGYVFGSTDAVADGDGIEENTVRRGQRDQVCESQANRGCQERCVGYEEYCFCATNGKTFRNQCEMACMRKVEMNVINWLHFGKCEQGSSLVTEAPTVDSIEIECPMERLDGYTVMTRELLVIEYLKRNRNNRRCSKLVSCDQLSRVLKHTEGRQSINECLDVLPGFFLFAGLDCTKGSEIRELMADPSPLDYVLQILEILSASEVNDKLNAVFNSEPVIRCKQAETVNRKLFNTKNCARDQNEPDLQTLVRWSFDHFDNDHNLKLDTDELNVLTNIPYQDCGEAFFRSCDKDLNGILREDEWAECLGCAGCHRPCQVFQSERKDKDRNTRFVQSIVQCEEDGTCAKKQCERQFGRHKLCWCVDQSCRKIEGTSSYAAIEC